MNEHVNDRGELIVPMVDRMAMAPKREGWVPRWVNVDLDRVPAKIVTYRRKETDR